MKRIFLMIIAVAVLLCGCSTSSPDKIDVDIKDVEYIKVNFSLYTQGYFIDYNDEQNINLLVDELNNATYLKWGIYDDLRVESLAEDDLQQGTISFYDSSDNIVFEFYLNGYLDYASSYKYCIIEENSIFVAQDEQGIDECVNEIVTQCSIIASDLLK